MLQGLLQRIEDIGKTPSPVAQRQQQTPVVPVPNPEVARASMRERAEELASLIR